MSRTRESAKATGSTFERQVADYPEPFPIYNPDKKSMIQDTTTADIAAKVEEKLTDYWRSEADYRRIQERRKARAEKSRRKAERIETLNVLTPMIAITIFMVIWLIATIYTSLTR